MASRAIFSSWGRHENLPHPPPPSIYLVGSYRCDRDNTFPHSGRPVVLRVIIIGDAKHIPLDNEAVQCVVTSPPYWGLRDYGNDSQLGLESTPEEYVANMITAFREVRRVLKSDGVVWLNLGDTYVSQPKGNKTESGLQSKNYGFGEDIPMKKNWKVDGLKPKDLVGIPWRVALALQADGWWLRRDIIWSKPNPMPESVTDRCTSSHEYIFMLTKAERYYYDADAIKEPGTYAGPNGPGTTTTPHGQGFSKRTREQEVKRQDKHRGHGRRHAGFNDRWDAMNKEDQCGVMRNKRSVWNIATRPYPEAHYATFPEEIPKICILASSMPGDVVLDPFGGSGTTGKVAIELGRKAVCMDISKEYAAGHMKKRMQTTIGFSF